MPKPVGLIKHTFAEFSEDNALRLAAAIAYYTALSLAPLLVIVLAAASLIYGQEAASEQLTERFQQYMGRDGAEVVSQIIEQASESDQSGWAALIGVVMLLVGATGVFAQLQTALNEIWDVKPKPSTNAIWTFIRQRILSLGMILTLGFLLLVSLVASAALKVAITSVQNVLPGSDLAWQIGSIVLQLVIFAGFFGAIFKMLPDVKIPWKDVVFGAVVTSVLFMVGQQLLSWYLGRGTVGSAYGVMGSIVVVLVWTYYSAVILFFGAELTQVWARQRGHNIRPDEHAVWSDTAPNTRPGTKQTEPATR